MFGELRFELGCTAEVSVDGDVLSRTFVNQHLMKITINSSLTTFVHFSTKRQV